MYKGWSFAARFSVHRVAPDSVVLASDARKFLLRGSDYFELAPALADQVLRSEPPLGLAGTTADEVIERLHGLGFVERNPKVSSPDGAGTAFWSSFGVPPEMVQARLADFRPALVDISAASAAPFAAALDRLGITVVPQVKDASMVVVLCDNYLDSRLSQINETRLNDRRTWLPLKLTGAAALVGPVIRPRAGACWRCIEHRMSGNQEVMSFLTGSAGAELLRDDSGRAGPAMVAVEFAALELVKFVVNSTGSQLGEHLLSFDLLGPAIAAHFATRRPTCPACGDLQRRSPLRAPTIPDLTETEKPYVTSGGMRARSPADTVARLSRQISPYTGVVSSVEPQPRPNGTFCFVARHRFSRNAGSLSSLRHGLLSKSSGKGSTRDQAMASALCEAVERYSGIVVGDEIRQTRAFSDFATGDAIDPRLLMQYSERQYAHRARSGGSSRTFVPQPFAANVPIEWTPIWSVTRQRFVFAPTALMYFFSDGPGHVQLFPSSNGMASGNTLAEAVSQGFLELVERDAFAIWWFNSIPRRGLQLGNSGDPYLKVAVEAFEASGRSIQLLDVTSDLGIPTVVAVSARAEGDQIIFGSGSHFDPQIAVTRAVTEAIQHLQITAEEPSPLRRQWLAQRLADHRYLMADPGQTPLDIRDLRHGKSDDETELQAALRVAGQAGLELLILDLTRPDIGLPVARVVVPGLRHFWPRFAEGRLYDVPIAAGWLPAPRAEVDLNPFFPEQ